MPRRRGRYRRPHQIPDEEYAKVGAKFLPVLESAGQGGVSLEELSNLTNGTFTTLIILVDMEKKGYVRTTELNGENWYQLTPKYYKRKTEVKKPEDLFKPAS